MDTIVTNFVAGLSPLINANKIDDIVSVNNSNIEPEKDMTLDEFRRVVKKAIGKNSLYKNEDDCELYIGTIYRTEFDLYPFYTNDFELPERVVRTLMRSLIELGCCYIGDIQYVEMMNDCYESQLSEYDKGNWYNSKYRALGNDSREKQKSFSVSKDSIEIDEDIFSDIWAITIYKEICTNGSYYKQFKKFINVPPISKMNISRVKGLKEKERILLEEIKAIYIDLKSKGFYLTHYSYPCYDSIINDERFFISNLPKEGMQIILNNINEMLYANGEVGQFMYDNGTNDLQKIESFIRLIDLINTL